MNERLRRRHAGHVLCVRAATQGAARAAMELLAGLLRQDRSSGRMVTLDGAPGYMKFGALRVKSRLRHGLRAALLGAPLPRVREARNLHWLRARLFQAPLPLAAGWATRMGLPSHQLLVTAEIAGARPFEECFPDALAEDRRAWLVELAREVGRMHALRFVHRDLFPRNLLLLPPGAGRRLVFLDAWAGGPGPGRRGPAYDLACFLLEGAELMSSLEQRTLLDTYLASRAEQGRPARGRFLDAVARERNGLLRRLRREPARLRGRAMPGPWSPPPAG